MFRTSIAGIVMNKEQDMKITTYMMALALSVGATSALAADDFVLPTTMDEIETFRNVSGWTVYQDKTSQSCFFSKGTEDGTALVQMGLTKNDMLAYMGLFSKDAGPDMAAEDIVIVINENVYAGMVNNVQQTANGYHGGYVVGFTGELRKDLNNAEEIVGFPDAPYTVTINMDGVQNAIFETRKCMEDLNS